MTLKMAYSTVASHAGVFRGARFSSMKYELPEKRLRGRLILLLHSLFRGFSLREKIMEPVHRRKGKKCTCSIEKDIGNFQKTGKHGK